MLVTSGTLFTVDSSLIGSPVAVPTSGLVASRTDGTTTESFAQGASDALHFVFTDTNLASLAGDLVDQTAPVSAVAMILFVSETSGFGLGAGLSGVGVAQAPTNDVVFPFSVGYFPVTYSFQVVPEPTIACLLLSGLAVLGARRRKA